MIRRLPPLLLPSAFAAAQQQTQGEGQPPDGLRLHVELAAGTGRFEFTTNGSPSRTGHTDAGYLGLTIELIGEHDVGGGVRLEGIRTDDDLFLDSGGIRSRGMRSVDAVIGTRLQFGAGELGVGWLYRRSRSTRARQ